MIAKTANALKAAGIQENDSVAIYSDNSAEWITFDLAILSLGAITVPIYSTNNAEQAEYIINDSQSKIIWQVIRNSTILVMSYYNAMNI